MVIENTHIAGTLNASNVHGIATVSTASKGLERAVERDLKDVFSCDAGKSGMLRVNSKEGHTAPGAASTVAV